MGINMVLLQRFRETFETQDELCHTNTVDLSSGVLLAEQGVFTLMSYFLVHRLSQCRIGFVTSYSSFLYRHVAQYQSSISLIHRIPKLY